MSWVVLGLFVLAILPAALVVWSRPVLALYAFAVGLVLHNTIFLLLFAAGARGWQLTVAQSWKEILLAVAFLSVYRGVPRTGRISPVEALLAIIFPRNLYTL